MFFYLYACDGWDFISHENPMNYMNWILKDMAFAFNDDVYICTMICVPWCRSAHLNGSQLSRLNSSPDSKVLHYRWGSQWAGIEMVQVVWKIWESVNYTHTHTYSHTFEDTYPGFPSDNDMETLSEWMFLISSLHFAGQSQRQRRERNWGNKCIVSDQIVGESKYDS